MDETIDYPIIIAGGGLVGALTALLIARQRRDWTIMILEPNVAGPAQDKRTLALAAATVATLQKLGVWTQLAKHACAIEHIHVSDRGHLGMTRIHAHQHGVPAMGEVIGAAKLNQALYQACLDEPNIHWCSDARFHSATPADKHIAVTYQQGEQTIHCTTQLVVGADGQRSQVRQDVGIAMHTTDYQQFGVIATLQLAQSLNGWAYERFTDSGPLALLPLPNQQASLVWSLTPAAANDVMALTDTDFIHACQAAFGYRAGLFLKVTDRAQYPLQLHLAQTHIHQRRVIIGNASHTLHPIAGQGFNLGVRDAITLSEILVSADDPGRYHYLGAYQQQRQQDYRRIIGLTDSLVRGFSNQYAPLVMGRNLALFGLDWCYPLRHRFARQTMGFQG